LLFVMGNEEDDLRLAVTCFNQIGVVKGKHSV
jgi:hypothetical protein